MVNGRAKGHQFEREVVRSLRCVFQDCERTQEGDSLDRAGVDIRGTANLRIQCKRGRKYSSANTLEEIKCNTGVPIVVTKGDRKRTVAILYMDDFLKIIQDIGHVYENHTDSGQKRLGQT